MKHFLPLMTWDEAREAGRQGRIAIVPIGSVEANGHVTPLGYDYLVPQALAERAALASGDVWLPPVTYGISESLDRFPGISVSPEHLRGHVEAILRSLIKSGFERILLITNHRPNQFPVEYACRRIRRETGVLISSVDPGQLTADLRGDVFEDGTVGHGADPGVSLMMYLHPGSVREDRAVPRPKAEFHGMPIVDPTRVRFGESTFNTYLEIEEVSPTSGWADPTRASVEKGERFFKAMLDYLLEVIEKVRTIDPRSMPPVVEGWDAPS